MAKVPIIRTCVRCVRSCVDKCRCNGGIGSVARSKTNDLNVLTSVWGYELRAHDRAEQRHSEVEPRRGLQKVIT
jgi:hypothetical protein